MASPYDGKPGFEEALAGVPDGRLDRRISNIHLHTFAQSMKSWREVAPYLGLTEAEEEEIVNDHRRHQEQKSAALRKWREKVGRRATYRNLAKAFYEAGHIDTIGTIVDVVRAAPCPESKGGSDSGSSRSQGDPQGQGSASTGARVYPSEPPKMKELMKLLFKEVPDKWDEIGTFLEIRASQLASIRQENLNNPQKCLLAMLNKWLDRQSPPPSWEAIAEAMELLGREDIAEKMATSPR